MPTARVTRQLSQNAILPQSVQGFTKGIPEAHALFIGFPSPDPANIASALTPFIQFQYIPLNVSLSLYALKVKLITYEAAAPVSPEIKAAIYKATGAVPGDNTDISGDAADINLKLTLVTEADNVAVTTTVTAPPVASDMDTIYSVFYFKNRPMLSPKEDYYLCLSSLGNGLGAIYGAIDQWDRGNWAPTNSAGLANLPKDISGLVKQSSPSISALLLSNRGAKRTHSRL